MRVLLTDMEVSQFLMQKDDDDGENDDCDIDDDDDDDEDDDEDDNEDGDIPPPTWVFVGSLPRILGQLVSQDRCT